MNTKTAIFAGGCFWCIEHDFRDAHGVTSVVSGYTGGSTENPTYEEVSHRNTGHREGVEVTYDIEKTNFKKLCQFFLDHIDPTDTTGQFADKGESYKSAIYFETEEPDRPDEPGRSGGEKLIAESLLNELAESGVYEKPVTVELLPRKTFYPAEEYHQNYAEKNPGHYAMYRKGSGREDFVNRTCAIREEKHIQWKD
jgi:peptide methionine sulfoxide reductase msrA/msrB